MRTYLLLFSLLISASLKSQESTVRKAQNNFDEAQQYVRQNITDQAIKYLDLAIKADQKFTTAYLQLGDTYKRIKDYEKAKYNYQQAINSTSDIDARVYFFLGETELLSGGYTKAKHAFQHFLLKHSGEEKLNVARAKKYIIDCDFAEKEIKNRVPYEPINMGFYINTENRDYFPALTADGQTIIFSRVVKGNEDFYISNKLKNEWTKAEPLSENINTPNFNEGAQSISPDGKYLFFTGCNRPDGLGRCDIFVSKKEGKEWALPVNLGPIVNSSNWESQPSISPDGSFLYFVSNRPGGIGGFDIWRSSLDEEGNWTAPVNLGPTINTPYDETTPFIHVDNKTLYFSSNGWPGFGSKDIYFSRILADGTFSAPKNLGYPLNTFNEETGLIVTADGNEGLFSSNLGGGFGDVDIYHFKMPVAAKPLPITYVKGVIRDAETKQPLEASILAISLDNNEVVYNDYTSRLTGDFLTVLPIGHQYSFNAQTEGYLFYSQHYELKEANANEPFEIEILLEKIKIGSEVTLNNIFFDTNKYELLPTSRIELEVLLELLKVNPEITIQIQGHTDNVGDVKSNQKLSENRAKAVHDYLIKNEVAGKRLGFKGYGETKPKADNMTEAGKKLNRRTEFIITKI